MWKKVVKNLKGETKKHVKKWKIKIIISFSDLIQGLFSSQFENKAEIRSERFCSNKTDRFANKILFGGKVRLT